MARVGTAPPPLGEFGNVSSATSHAPTKRKLNGPPTESGAVRANGDDGFAPGTSILGHYTVVRQLGRGGMGTVYLARDDVSAQEVAVKVLPGALGREKDIRDRFIQEARALAAMDHPNIVPLVTFSQEGEDRFLVMKYIAGEPLDARLRRNRVLAPDECKVVLRAILAGLGYAHAHGVVHRDVKPSNVIIEGDLDANASHRIFLVDFGIAKKEQDGQKLTQTGMLMGTPQYMSPEQISGHAVDGRSDLYAAGLVLFEMLCGRPPFDGDKTFQVLRAHVEAPVPDPVALRGSAIPQDLVHLTHLLLAKDPSHRPMNANAAIALLDDANMEATAYAPRVTPVTVSMPKPATTVPPRPVWDPPMQMRSVGASVDEPSRDELRAVTSSWTPRAAAVLLFTVAAGGSALWMNRERPVVPAATVADAGSTLQDVALTMLMTQARLKMEAHDLDNARLLVETLLDKEPDNIKARLLHIDVLVQMRATALAQVELAATRALPGVDADVVARLDAFATVVQQQRDAAILESERAAERDAEPQVKNARSKKDRRGPPSTLSSSAVLAVTGATRLAMRRCYEDEVLKDSASAEGEVRLELTIEANGAPSKINVDAAPALTRGRFSACVRDAAKSWRFPAWKGTSEAFRHKIRFNPQ